MTSPHPTEHRRQFMSSVGCALATCWLPQMLHADKPNPRLKRLKIGQIGTSHAHATKLGVYRNSPDYEVVGLVEPDPQRRKLAAAQSAFADLPFVSQEQLLNAPDVQAVLVETPVRNSLMAAEACIAAGKHVHLDKPAGESLTHYQSILAAAERQQLLVQMGYMYRYNPAIMLLRQFLRDGWLGDVFEVHTVMSKVVPPTNRRRLADYSGGIMFELGCHIIDLVINVLGAPHRVTSYARQETGGHADSLADNMLAVLEYPTALATVKSSAVEVEGFQRRHFVACGTQGTFHIQPLDSPAARVALSLPRGPYQPGYQDIGFPKYTRYLGDAMDMARVIRGETEPQFSYAHDLAVQKAVLQASGLSIDDASADTPDD